MAINAMVMHAPGEDGTPSPLEAREFPEPKLKKGAALLHTLYSEVCGTDVHLSHGRLAGVPYPLIPGHVSVGVLGKIRDRVDDVMGQPFHEGDTAAFLDVHGTCGFCVACSVDKASTRCPDRRVYGITFGAKDKRAPLGGWSEQIHLLPGTKLLRLPEGLPPETYIGGGCGLNTALHAVDRADIKLGNRVVVLGAGPVGQSVVAFASLSGAEVLVFDGLPDRLDLARRMGATHTSDLSRPLQERLEWVKERTGAGRGADIVIEAAGAPTAVTDALEMVRDGGRVVVVGQYTDNGSVEVNPHTLINKKHVEVRGCWGSDFSHFYRAIAVMGREHLKKPWHELAGQQFDLADTQKALDAIARREMVKAVIRPNRVLA